MKLYAIFSVFFLSIPRPWRLESLEKWDSRSSNKPCERSVNSIQRLSFLVRSPSCSIFIEIKGWRNHSHSISRMRFFFGIPSIGGRGSSGLIDH